MLFKNLKRFRLLEDSWDRRAFACYAQEEAEFSRLKPCPGLADEWKEGQGNLSGKAQLGAASSELYRWLSAQEAQVEEAVVEAGKLLQKIEGDDLHRARS